MCPFCVQPCGRPTDPETPGIIIAFKLDAAHPCGISCIDVSLELSRPGIRIEIPDHNKIIDFTVESRHLQTKRVVLRKDPIDVDIGANFPGFGSFRPQDLVGCILGQRRYVFR
ncbi:hypothetical protein D3C87_1890410 [compost metagenome]